jgi:hypothetical protein
MDGPRTSTDQSSLEDFTEGYRFSQDLNSTSLDVNDYIDFNHNTASETPVGADESIVDSSGDQNGQYKNNFSPDGSWGVFDELGELLAGHGIMLHVTYTEFLHRIWSSRWFMQANHIGR